MKGDNSKQDGLSIDQLLLLVFDSSLNTNQEGLHRINNQLAVRAYMLFHFLQYRVNLVSSNKISDIIIFLTNVLISR